MAETTISIKPRDGKLTLTDLKDFIAQLEEAGAQDSTLVKGAVSMGGNLKAVRATIERTPSPSPVSAAQPMRPEFLDSPG